MRTATDRLDILLHLLEAGIPITNIVGLQIFVLQEEWNRLPYGSRLSLAPLKAAKVILFMDLKELFFSEIYSLQKMYGTGIDQHNYYILRYCMNQSVTLITCDDTIIKIAKELRIQVRRPEAFRLDLMMRYNDESKEPMEIRVKKKKNDMYT